MRFQRCTLIILFALCLADSCLGQRGSQPSDAQQVLDTVKSIFDAAKADDFKKFNSIVLPGYYMFDGGARFEGDAILKFIRDDHAKGIKYEWAVTDPDVHVNGNSAWIAYVNHGSITDAQGKVTKLNWLESAFLEKHDGAWKIAFFHSTRMPAAPDEK